MTDAELLPADKARAYYEDIVRKMKDPALLEYAGRGAFKLRVYPIEPMAGKRVRITYTRAPEERRRAGGIHLPAEHGEVQRRGGEGRLGQSDPGRPRAAEERVLPQPPRGNPPRRRQAGRGGLGGQGRMARHRLQGDVQPHAQPAGHRPRDEPPRGRRRILHAAGLAGRRAPTGCRCSQRTSASCWTPPAPWPARSSQQAKKALRFCLANLGADDRFEIVRFSTETEPLFGSLVPRRRGAYRAGGVIRGRPAAHRRNRHRGCAVPGRWPCGRGAGRDGRRPYHGDLPHRRHADHRGDPGGPLVDSVRGAGASRASSPSGSGPT